ncbi:TAXI family TRAP transporter solute-binding subunit [Paenarthrobacter sp. NPDC089322]|uniref:TAXI family TRAP transporter solute-binding subunit n=1 Tax=Paenarthrobacter sp. NPDC089322 TaxID=3155065 RepID=UPI003421948B
MAELMARRTVLKAGLALGVLIPSASCTPGSRPQQLTVAGGEPGGFYLEFATLLADLLEREGVAATASPVVTGGSLDNVRRVLSGEATFAVALADTALTETSAGQAGGQLVALGKVYENYVHCIVRDDSRINTFADLAGKTAAVGEVGSGTTLTAGRIIAAAGLAPDQVPVERAVKQVNLGLNEALTALKNGSIDVMIQSGGVPTAPVVTAAKDMRLRLLDLSGLIPETRAQSGFFYDRVLIPANSYGDAPAVWTVGVANLLLCRRDLSDEIVEKTVELLVEHAQNLVPASSTGVQFLSPETLINTANVPLHPSAEGAYRALHG